MSLQNTASTEVKAQVYALIDQLSSEQLRTLYQFLQQSFFVNGSRNGLAPTHVPASDATIVEEQPWRQYTTHLKTSPHWDEFLEAVAAARQETSEDEDHFALYGKRQCTV